MSYVVAIPDMLASAAADVAGIGSSVGAANTAAVGATTGVMAAADDEVSVAIAALFSGHGRKTTPQSRPTPHHRQRPSPRSSPPRPRCWPRRPMSRCQPHRRPPMPACPVLPPHTTSQVSQPISRRLLVNRAQNQQRVTPANSGLSPHRFFCEMTQQTRSRNLAAQVSTEDTTGLNPPPRRPSHCTAGAARSRGILCVPH